MRQYNSKKVQKYVVGGKSKKLNRKTTKKKTMKEKFTHIYEKNIWGSSGTGSNFSINNKWFLNELRTIIDKYNIKSIVDLGCGDWEIMKHFKFNKDEKYTGIDVVDFLIKNHNKKYKKSNIKFIQGDISQEVPSGYDLVILKDVIQHWDDEHVLEQLPKILKKINMFTALMVINLLEIQAKINGRRDNLIKSIIITLCPLIKHHLHVLKNI